MTPRQLIIIGAVVLASPPIIVGIIISHFYDAIYGIAAGVLLFALVLAIAHRVVMRRAKQQDKTRDE